MSSATQVGAADVAAVTGVLGGRWRADVTTAGDVRPWDGGPTLAWHIAADDRWHTPSAEAAVRQVQVEGTPVVETRVRIPSGDAVQQVWSVPDSGGLTLVSVTNESPLPIAVAFSRGDLLSVRAPTNMPIDGIVLPAGSVAFPIGHHSTITVGLAHRDGRAGQLPAAVPSAEQVVRGWLTTSERAGRVVLPGDDLVTAMIEARCALALGGPGEPGDDPVAFLLAVGELVRMGEPADDWMPDVASAAERIGRGGGRRRRAEPTHRWDVGAALDAAVDVALVAGHRRAVDDLVELRSRLSIDRTLPASYGASPAGDEGVDPSGPNADARALAWQERRLVDPAPPGACRLLPLGLPESWLGANLEIHGLPAGDGAVASFAVRWHGERPAVLWEVSAGTVLSAPVVAPGWSAGEAAAGATVAVAGERETVRGEALWPAPPLVPGRIVAPDEPPAAVAPTTSVLLEITDDGGSFQ